MNPRARVLSTSLALLSFAACGGDEIGDYQLRISGGPAVEEGLAADGWQIDVEQFVVSIKDISVTGPDGDGSYAGSWMFDLARDDDGASQTLGSMALVAGTYESLAYRIAPDTESKALVFDAGSDAEVASATEEQIATMHQEGYSILIAGTATRGDETITFNWGFDTDTYYASCDTGGPVGNSALVQTEITVLASRLFRDDLTPGAGALAFDPIAAADADMDGEVTLAELEAVDITSVPGLEVGDVQEIPNLRAFIRAQSQTMGHVRGGVACTVE